MACRTHQHFRNHAIVRIFRAAAFPGAPQGAQTQEREARQHNGLGLAVLVWETGERHFAAVHRHFSKSNDHFPEGGGICIQEKSATHGTIRRALCALLKPTVLCHQRAHGNLRVRSDKVDAHKVAESGIHRLEGVVWTWTLRDSGNRHVHVHVRHDAGQLLYKQTEAQ